jgi:steroid 5-alpha reductase family enzyme
VITQAWALVDVGACATMTCVWLVSIRIGNAGYVDVAWAYGITATAVTYALLADGSALHRALDAGLGAVWGVRLGTYLLNRLAGHEEDGRYRELRRRWAPHANRSFFVFFQATGGSCRPLLGAACARRDRHGSVAPLAWPGAALALAAIAGEAVADAQLAAWKADPATRARPRETASGAGHGTRTTSSSGCTGWRGR